MRHSQSLFKQARFNDVLSMGAEGAVHRTFTIDDMSGAPQSNRSDASSPSCIVSPICSTSKVSTSECGDGGSNSLVHSAISGRGCKVPRVERAPKRNPRPTRPEPELWVDVYADAVHIRRLSADGANTDYGSRAGGRRGKVTRFSDKSRVRMMRMFSRVRNPGNLWFVTLTYRDEEFFGDQLSMGDVQAHMLALFKRIERRFAGVGIVWRKEYQTRKSGAYTGMVAPHIHLVIRGIPSLRQAVLARWVSYVWSQITGAADRDARARVDVQQAVSRKHAYKYLSKYVAKSEVIGDVIDEFLQVADGVGRHWGYRGNWDLSASMSMRVDVSVVVHLKRLLRSWLGAHGSGRYARKCARVARDYSMFVMGLGDGDGGVFDAQVSRMLLHALVLAGGGPENKGGLTLLS